MANNNKNWLAYSGMALEMFVTIGIFTGLGFFLDSKLNSSPILTITLLFAGLSMAFYRIFRQFK